ncbi:hypothetical protein NHU_03150 [Rhodovulum sulfidophilum]|uniref:Transposase IS4-like domain-containing protein n=1 Tax=Rhodovulum sulfidophilum TaxID=35806 RepID=A0A0D6B574_RHOSU|nr:hypothetical protein NHU_03150 [Rhodovulum sulfidophilum]
MQDFSALSRHQKTLAVSIPYRGSQGPLNLLIDNEALTAIGPRAMPNGIKAEGEGAWRLRPFRAETTPRVVSGSPLLREHGGTKRCLWRKIHIGADEQTLGIRAIEITGSNVGDAPMLPEFLDRIPADVEIGMVTTDGACDTRKFHDAVADRGADAVTRHLGRALRRWTGDHVRSRAEARMNGLKAFGERIMSRDPDRQTAEIQIRIIRDCRSDQ